MLIGIFYIGLAQSLFAAILTLQKKPLKIADKILAVWMLMIGCRFAINVVSEHYNLRVSGIGVSTWPYSLSITIVCAPFLYLYTKYTVTKYSMFKIADVLHCLVPFALVWYSLFLFRGSDMDGTSSFLDYYNDKTAFRNTIGLLYLTNFWLYSILAIKKIYNYKKTINDLYSYSSDIISLSWLRLLVISFFAFCNLGVIIGALEGQGFYNDIKVIREFGLLAFVYVFSIWGYKQIQLDSHDKQEITLIKDENISKINTVGKYQRSGLKDSQANSYLQQLIQCMEQSEIWKDNELSVAKLTQFTNIPKYYITQVLNESLGKNFYTFVNEYRVEHAKKLIKSPEYKAWSLVAIGYECGFNSKTAFNSFFKKYTGMTPSEYRSC